MERIILEVDDNLGKAWRNTSVKLRERLEMDLVQQLSNSLSETREVNFELLLQDARKDAAKNGLTEEILTQLLNDED